MVFRNFRFQIILRVILIFAVLSILAWCLVTGLYLRSFYVGAGALILLVELIWYIDRFNRDVKTFMISLQQRDFTTHFQSKGQGQTFDELYGVLNQITASFKKINSEKEIQYRYLEMLIDHVRVSILSIDDAEQIHMANQAAKKLLQKNVLTSLKSFDSFDAVLVSTIRQVHTGQTKLIQLNVNDELLQLSIHASEFKLDGKYYKLVSMQNIRTELDKREMDAWQKLIRVLSHEIMNSVAPIMSLSDTLHGAIKQTSCVDADQYNMLDKGLEAIKIRSEGLYSFTQSYRKLTGIPTMSIKKTALTELIGRVNTLMQPKLDEQGVELVVRVEEVVIDVDPQLMEHVLINLFHNAMEAVSGNPDARIQLKTTRTVNGKLSIQLQDNGEGIDESIADKIFIPFFTTRKNGSGIGLALTKQILQLHGADIQFKSKRGEGAEFIIVF